MSGFLNAALNTEAKADKVNVSVTIAKDAKDTIKKAVKSGSKTGYDAEQGFATIIFSRFTPYQPPTIELEMLDDAAEKEKDALVKAVVWGTVKVVDDLVTDTLTDKVTTDISINVYRGEKGKFVVDFK